MMEARKDPDAANFLNSGAGELIYAQAQYYSRTYHDLPIRMDDRFSRFFYLFAEHHFKFKQKWIAGSFDVFPKPLMNAGYRLFGSRDYTGLIAVTREFCVNAMDAAINDGAEQVLIIGGVSFYGTLNHQQHERVNFFEVSCGDSFTLQQNALNALRDQVYPNKKTLIAAKGLEECARTGENMRYINADFTQADLPGRLLANGFNPEKKTVCYVRGTCYFTPEEVMQIFANVKVLLSSASQLITLIVPPQPGKAYQKVSDSYGAHVKMVMPTEATPHYLFERGFYMSGKFPNTSIYTTAGLTEAQARASTPQQNIFVARPATEHDAAPALSDVPLLSFDWKHEHLKFQK